MASRCSSGSIFPGRPVEELLPDRFRCGLRLDRQDSEDCTSCDGGVVFWIAVGVCDRLGL